ncbi:cyclic nucleotide-binding domain-containing protein [Bradyrhizobium pachyrhizi]|uniref:Cyclic nucleotide-binding domain-containing protein n=1 Tax=Bradyrhizobium pachyrhizi TaxID=280333 RepID=A0A844SSX8_9BRAD|nr:cyclic nucleotide-binding domain-containing protein [Bradyrhizobium pachyrhizi]MVT66482.1 cyclic nucleotide-binding domain-containing protein [Bradyrhizobium pachyrhizi]
MRAILDHCTGGRRRSLPAGTDFIEEGGKTGHLFVLLEGKVEVVKGDSLVAVIDEPGAVFGEMSVLLDRAHSAKVRTANDCVLYEFDDAASFLRQQPAVALLIAQLLAQRLHVATTYLADLMHQYADHGTHLAMVGEVLQSMINLPPMQVAPGSDRQSDPRI